MFVALGGMVFMNGDAGGGDGVDVTGVFLAMAVSLLCMVLLLWLRVMMMMVQRLVAGHGCAICCGLCCCAG